MEDRKNKIIILMHQKLNDLKARATLENFVSLPKDFTIYNAGQRCDMFTGPCACGAWHKYCDHMRMYDQEEKIITILEAYKSQLNAQT